MNGPPVTGLVEGDNVSFADPAGEPATTPSLKSLAVKGSTWTLIEYGLSQVLRLANSYILTRLLVPEAFGVMLLVQAVIQGLDMFSDLGLGQSIIHDKRGADSRFLNTAWTLQVIRGVMLFVVALALGWAVSLAYPHMPELLYLIPVCALGTVINGFSSMNLHLLNRQIQLRRIAEINLGVQILTIVLTISWALLWPTVWALVGAYVIANTGRLIASHTLCPGPRARFEWDCEAAWSMFRFGRWIFLSTVLGFVATRGDSFILGLVETSAFLGVYAIALFLNQGMVQALHTISSRVLFPIYSRLAETSPVRLQDQMFRMRAVIMAITVPAVCVVVVFGNDIVSIVYDDRYAEAGWMLELLSAGAVASIIGSTIGPALLAVGDSFRFMMLMAIRTVALLASMYYFWQQFGTVGLVFGVAIPDCITYPFLVVMVRKYGVWHHWLDLTGFLSAFALIHLGWMVWN